MLSPKIIFPFLLLNICVVYAQNEAKHDIFVTSAAVQHLYRNCANMVNIDVPDLCSDYNPTCTTTNADIEQSSDFKRKFRIVPKGNKCTLSVSNNVNGSAKFVGDIAFQVIEPPKPNIEILLNGQKVSSNAQVAKGSIFMIRIIPSAEFANVLPQDARYCMSKVSFYIQHCFGVTKVGEVDLSSKDANEGIKIPIPSDVFKHPSGSKIYMEISDIYRISYKGDKITDNRMTLYEKTLSFLVR